MSILTSLQRDFIIESESNINKYDLACTRLMREAAFVDNTMNKPLISPVPDSVSKYYKKIDDSMNHLTNLTVDASKLAEFYAKVEMSEKIADFPLSIQLKNADEVGRIKASYGLQYAKDFASFIQDVLNGRKAMGEAMSYFNSNPTEKVKRQIVSGYKSIPNTKTYLKGLESPIVVPIDSQSIMAVCVPYLRSFPTRQKELVFEVNDIKSNISEIVNLINQYTTALQGIIARGEVGSSIVDVANYVLYNMNRSLNEICTYTALMLMTKIEANIFNVNSYTELYNKMVSYVPEGSNAYHESTYEDSLASADIDGLVNDALSGDMSGLIDWSDRTYNSAMGLYKNTVELSTPLSDVIDTELDGRDKNPYGDLLGSFERIGVGTDKLLESLKDPYVVPADVFKDAGFETDFISRFGSVPSDILNISSYNDDEKMNSLLNILAEMKNSKEYLKDIGESAAKAYSRIIETLRAIRDEGVVTNLSARDESFSLMNEVEKNYRNYLGVVFKNIIQRYKILEDKVESLVNNLGENIDLAIPEVDPGYDVAAAESAINFDKALTMLAIECEMAEFKRLKLAKEYNLFTEADQPIQTTPPADNANQTGVVSNGTPNKADSDARIQAEAKKAASESKTQAKTDNAGKVENNREKAETITENIKQFFEKVLKTCRDFLVNSTTNNSEFITTYKDVIIGRSWNGIIVNMYNYDLTNYSIDNLKAEITSVSNAVSALDPTKVATLTDDGILRDTLFKDLKWHFKTGAVLDDSLKLYYQTGPDMKEFKAEKLRGAELRKNVESMIAFCENVYVNNQGNDIINALSSLDSTVEGKVKDWTSGQNVPDNVMDGCKKLNSAISHYVHALLVGFQGRCTHYMKIIRALLPKQYTKQDEAADVTNNGNNGTTESQPATQQPTQ